MKFGCFVMDMNTGPDGLRSYTPQTDFEEFLHSIPAVVRGSMLMKREDLTFLRGCSTKEDDG